MPLGLNTASEDVIFPGSIAEGSIKLGSALTSSFHFDFLSFAHGRIRGRGTFPSRRKGRPATFLVSMGHHGALKGDDPFATCEFTIKFDHAFAKRWGQDTKFQGSTPSYS